MATLESWVQLMPTAAEKHAIRHIADQLLDTQDLPGHKAITISGATASPLTRGHASLV